MGAADIVPGVSGGTIAFITGIYLRLLSALGAVPKAVVKDLFQRQFQRFWQRIDGVFLLILFAGILLSVVTLSRGIHYALEAWPIFLWSFFLGLILASAWHISKQVPRWRWSGFVFLVIGMVMAWAVTSLAPGQIPVTSLTIFGAGALAICAMILPGISGSFILLLMGMYAPILTAINDFQLGRLALFATGCLLGLLSVARLLSAAIARFPGPMLALLTGFMLGALEKVWPWKEVLSWRTNSNGEQAPLEQANLSPFDYLSITGEPSHLSFAVCLMLLGIAVVLGFEWLGQRRERQNATSVKQ